MLVLGVREVGSDVGNDGEAVVFDAGVYDPCPRLGQLGKQIGDAEVHGADDVAAAVPGPGVEH